MYSDVETRHSIILRIYNSNLLSRLLHDLSNGESLVQAEEVALSFPTSDTLSNVFSLSEEISEDDQYLITHTNLMSKVGAIEKVELVF